MRKACSTQSTYSAGRQQADHVRPAEDQRLAVPPALRHGPTLRLTSHDGSSVSGAHGGSSATSRRSPGPTTRSRDEAIRRYAYTDVYRNTLDYFARELEAIGFAVEEDAVGTLFARNRPKGEPVFGDRLALRLEPERRQVRRDDGRRHRARGLPAERRARPRPAAAADLVPRGGGLGLRADAARQPDHRAARHRGGPARALPLDRRRRAASGSTPRRPATSPSAGASARTCSTT